MLFSFYSFIMLMKMMWWECGKGGQLRLSPSAGRGSGSDLAILGANQARVMSGASTGPCEGSRGGPIGYGSVHPHRAQDCRFMVLDCVFLTEQGYSFTAIVYFFTFNHRAGPVECSFGSEHSPIIVLASRFSAHAVAQPVRSRPSPCSTSLSHTIPSMIPRVSLSAATTARGRQRLELAVLTSFISKRRMFQKRSVASTVTEVKAVIAVAQCRSRFWLFRCDYVFDLSARQFQRRQFPQYATFQTGFFGLASGTTNCLHCTFGIHTSIAQQNAYTYSLAGMFKGYAMSRHLAQTCDNSSVYPHTTLAVPDACAPFGVERRLLRRRLMIDHFLLCPCRYHTYTLQQNAFASTLPGTSKGLGYVGTYVFIAECFDRS